MVVTPQKVMESIEKEDRRILQNLEREIDDKIRKEFPDYTGGVFIDVPAGLKPRIMRKIEQMYSDNGWSVQYNSSQRDGDFWQFKPKIRGDRR